MNRNHLGVAVLLAMPALALTACGGDRGATSATSLSVLPGGSWEGTLQRARWQTVRWWLYGGDERINRYIDERVAPRAARLGLTLRRVADRRHRKRRAARRSRAARRP